jgi:hypothetical protein
MSPEQCLAATASRDWSTIADLQAHLASCGYWDGVQANLATQVLHVQEMLALTDAKDWPLFGRMERPDGQCVWKQEAAFTPEDYQAVIAYHVQQAQYAQQMVHTITTAYCHDN